MSMKIHLIIWVITISNFILSNYINGGIDVIFIVDGSSHTEEILFRKELLLISSIIENLPIIRKSLRFSVVTYSNFAYIQIRFGLFKNNRALMNKLLSIKQRRNYKSSLYTALKLTRLYLIGHNPSWRQKFVIIFTNGRWNLPHATSSEAKILRKMGVKILILIIGHRINRYASYRLASSSSVLYRPHITFNHMNNQKVYNFIFKNIHNVINQEVKIHSSKATNNLPDTNIFTNITSTNSWESVTPSIFISTITSQPACSLFGEIVFIFDSTAYVGPENFRFQKETIKNILRRIFIDKRQSSLAMATYGQNAIINLSFETFLKTEDIMKEVEKIKFTGGDSGSGVALSLINQELFKNKPDQIMKRIVVLFVTEIRNIGPDPIIVSSVMKNNNGVNILLIGVGSKANRWVSERIASNTNFTIFVQNFSDLPSVQEDIIKKLCDI